MTAFNSITASSSMLAQGLEGLQIETNAPSSEAGIGANDAATATASASQSPEASATIPTNNASLHLPSSTTSSSTSSIPTKGLTAPPPTPVIERRMNNGNIMDSLLEISLDAEGGEDGTVGGTGGQQQHVPSAARTLIELKAIEKKRNELNPIVPVPSRRGGGGGSGSTGGNPFTSSLDQASASFEEETGRLILFDRMHKKGRKAVLSHKARQRQKAGSEREEAYAEKLGGRVMKHNRRKERMDRLKKIY